MNQPLWSLKKKEKKKIAKQQLKEFFSRVKFPEEKKPESIRIVYFYRLMQPGRKVIIPVTDETFNEKTLTADNLEKYIRKIKKEFTNTKNILQEISIPKKYYDELGITECLSVKITVME